MSQNEIPCWKLTLKTVARIFCGKNTRPIYIIILALLMIWSIGIIQSYFVGPIFTGPEPLLSAVFWGIFLIPIYVIILILFGFILYIFFIIIFSCKRLWKETQEELIKEHNSQNEDII